MTEQRVPMAITGKQMSRVYNAKDLKEVEAVMDEIRDIACSRPAPAAPSQQVICELCHRSQRNPEQWNLQHDATIREQAKREGYNEALDAIRAFTKGNSETIEADDGTLEDAVFLGELIAKIESLRSHRTPTAQERDTP